MANDPAPPESYDQLCKEVGNLVLNFGSLENILTITLKWHLRDNMYLRLVPDGNAGNIASAVFGAMRFKASRDTIKRILKAEKTSLELSAFLADAFAQIGHIEELRDKIAHQAIIDPSDSHSGEWEAWDVFTTRDLTNDNVWSFTINSVTHAWNDTRAFVDRLSGHLSKQDSHPTGDLFGSLDLSPIAWRYKPSMLRLLPRSKRRVPRSRKRPPQSSEE